MVHCSLFYSAFYAASFCLIKFDKTLKIWILKWNYDHSQIILMKESLKFFKEPILRLFYE